MEKQGFQKVHFSSVQSLSHVLTLQPHGLQYARPPCPSPTHGVYSNLCSLSQWRHPTISSSVIPFSSCLQSFPASGSFQRSQFFTSGGQGISFSISPSNDYSECFPLGLTDLISFQTNRLSRIFSNTKVQNNQFFNAQPSLWSNSHIHIWRQKTKQNKT